jgi:hypothetical protein
MPPVLTKANMLTCAYRGTISPGDSKLLAGGQSVLTKSSVEGKAVAACKASASQQPSCATVGSVTAGAATKLTVGGAAVLLSGMIAGTDQPAPHVVGPIAGGFAKLVAS